MARLEPVLTRRVHQRDHEGNRRISYLLDNACGLLLGLKEGQKGEGEIDEAGEVDAHLVVEGRKIDFCGLGEVVGGLDAGVEKEAVEVGVLGGDSLHKVVEIVGVVNVVGEAIGFAAVLADEVVDSILSTADGDDFTAFAN